MFLTAAACDTTNKQLVFAAAFQAKHNTPFPEGETQTIKQLNNQQFNNMKTYLKFLSRNKLYTAIEFVGLSVALAFVIISFCYVVQQ